MGWMEEHWSLRDHYGPELDKIGRERQVVDNALRARSTT